MQSYRERMLEQQVAVFDVDMTLVDTFKKCHIGTIEFLRQHGIEDVSEQWTRTYVMPASVPEILTEMGMQWGVRFKPDARSTYENALAAAGEHTIVYDGVAETFEWLLEHGKRIALATGSTNVELQPSLIALEKACGKSPWSSIVTIDDVASNPKPHPRSIELNLERLGGGIERYAMLGDSERDMQAAKRSTPRGMGVFINTGGLSLPAGLAAYEFESMAKQYEALR